MKPYWTNGIARLYQADAREIPLPDQSVHCCVTSPPYWGQRDYSLPDGIGLELTITEWLYNILDVMREVHRVLRDDGVCWLNLGDAYAGSGKGMNRDGTHALGPKQASSLGSQTLSVVVSRRIPRGPGSGRWGGGGLANEGYRHKDLFGLPWEVARALRLPWLRCVGCGAVNHQIKWGYFPNGKLICPECWGSKGAEVEIPGWIRRSPITWFKTNPMPESTRDRPTNASEMIFMLVKDNRTRFWVHRTGATAQERPMPDHRWVHRQTGAEVDTRPEPFDKTIWYRINLWQGWDYFYDGEAIRTPAAKHGDGTVPSNWATHPDYEGQNPNYKPRNHVRPQTNMWDRMSRDEQIAMGANARNVWPMASQGIRKVKGKRHLATFPEELPETCILAGTSAKGVCSSCGAPWVRIVEKSGSPHESKSKNLYDPNMKRGRVAQLRQAAKERGEEYQQPVKTVGWSPTCSCNAEVIPATVLDPFVGSGTTLLVAQRLGRLGVGLDLSADYLDIAKVRIDSTAVTRSISLF